MRKIRATIVLAVLVVILIGINVMAYLGTDRTAPEISVPKSITESTYHEGESKSSLLKGVTATDNKDGDISKTLRVAEILRNGDGKSVTVTYMAKDQSQNVAAKSIVLPLGK